MRILNEVLPWWACVRRAACPHVDVQAIYGDQTWYTPGFRRMCCRRCGRFLDGPVQIATDRHDLVTRYRTQED